MGFSLKSALEIVHRLNPQGEGEDKVGERNRFCPLGGKCVCLSSQVLLGAQLVPRAGRLCRLESEASKRNFTPPFWGVE